jgi:hypothetical protein
MERYITYLSHEIKEENVELLNKHQLDRIRYTVVAKFLIFVVKSREIFTKLRIKTFLNHSRI